MRPAPLAIQLLSALLFLTLPLAANKYRMKMVGPRSPCSWVSSINDQGQVVGSYVNSKKEMRHFFWSESRGFIDLGVTACRREGLELPDFDNSYCTETSPLINQRGMVAGHYVKAGQERLFVWNPSSKLHDIGFKKRSGEYGFSDDILDINNLNHVLINHGNEKLYLWKEGKRELLPINYQESFINDAGEIHGLEERVVKIPCPTSHQGDPDDIILECGRLEKVAKLYDLKCGKSVGKPVWSLSPIDFNNHSVGLWRDYSEKKALVWDKEGWSRAIANFQPVALNDRGEILGYHFLNEVSLFDDRGELLSSYQTSKEIPVIIDGPKTLSILDAIERALPFEKLRVFALNNHGDIAGAICIGGQWRALILEKIVDEAPSFDD